MAYCNMPPLVLITRSEEQSQEFVKDLNGLGFETLVQPLLNIKYIPFLFSNLQKPDALLLTSSHALGNTMAPEDWVNIPVFCVGDKTSGVAIKAGFRKTLSGDGGLKDLLPTIYLCLGKTKKILYLRGQDISHETQKILPEYRIEEIITYRAEPISKFDESIVKKFNEINIVTLFSKRSAETFKKLTIKHALDLNNAHAICLSDAVLDSVNDLHWKSCSATDYPNQESVIEKIKALHVL